MYINMSDLLLHMLVRPNIQHRWPFINHVIIDARIQYFSVVSLSAFAIPTFDPHALFLFCFLCIRTEQYRQRTRISASPNSANVRALAPRHSPRVPPTSAENVTHWDNQFNRCRRSTYYIKVYILSCCVNIISTIWQDIRAGAKFVC